MFIGLMGINNNGVLVTPSGRNLIKVPLYIAIIIQRIQHWIARISWKYTFGKNKNNLQLLCDCREVIHQLRPADFDFYKKNSAMFCDVIRRLNATIKQ